MNAYESQPGPDGGLPMQVSSDDRTMATLTHALGAVFTLLVPLVIWLINKDNPAKRFVNEHAKEALNFQITMLIAYAIAGVLSIPLAFVFIGFMLVPVVYVLNIIFGVIAAMASNKGERYRYPFALRLIA